MRPLWGYVLAAVVLVGAGYAISQEHQARVEAEVRLAAWKDSVKAVSLRAATAQALFDSTKAAYYAQKPAVVQITKWKARIDTVTNQIAVQGDTAGAALVQAIFDSVTTDCARRDSLARAAMEQATAALAAKDSVIRIVSTPPQVPTKRIGFYGEAAYDLIAHGAVVNAGVYLKLGKVNPYAAIGAAIAKQATGTMQVGVRVSW
jgi:hypothetical protein